MIKNEKKNKDQKKKYNWNEDVEKPSNLFLNLKKKNRVVQFQ